MKLQYLAVIFVIIIIPISLVMSNYIQTQIDTITLQSSYQNYLDNATYDALKAFQVNSVNNKYASISDSKIRDVEASINTFYNSLGTSMSNYVSSRDELSTFVPAILFTLYDGYYIYSSYDNVYTREQTKIKSTIYGTETTELISPVEITDNGNNYQDGLRPYIYYSCKYKLKNGNIIIVNYTLDNAITVYGDFGNGYETKTGYLINPNKVTDINSTNKTLKYDGIEIGPEYLSEYLLTINDDESVTGGEYKYIVYNNKKVYEDNTTDGRYFWYDNYKKTYLNSEAQNVQAYINNNGVGFRSISAYEYYTEAKEFSEWVEKNLGDITQENVIKLDGGTNTIGSDINYLSENTEKDKIFKFGDKNDPMLSNSIFNTHRIAIIRKSIETNLTAAIANYNTQSGSNYEFSMPVMNDENWYKIVNNVSIVSFMQGFPIGQKYFNNYSVITNTRNEEVINEQSIYILTQNDKGIREYHQVGCKELIQQSVDNKDKMATGQFTMTAYTDLSFLRQTVKVSETNIHYFYPHTADNNVGQNADTYRYVTGCYNCIVNANTNYDIDEIISGNVEGFSTDDLKAVRKTYLTGLARERYDLYRSNFDL